MEPCVQEFIDYIKGFLEKPHERMQNLPVCPFVHRARTHDKLIFHDYRFSPQDLIACEQLDIWFTEFAAGSKETLIIIDPDREGVGNDTMRAIARLLQGRFAASELLVFEGVSDDPFNVAGMRTRKEPFPHLIVQKRSILEAARQILKHTRYYANWSDDDLREVGIDPKTFRGDNA
jgi:hypothetical protein